MANEAVMDIINKKIEELIKQKQELLEKSLKDKVNNNINKEVLDINFKELDLNKKRDIACVLINKVIVYDDTIEIMFKV